jgi:hypothetical protein
MTQDTRFEKSRACPTNEALLAFQRHALSSVETSQIAEHLQDCEFCFLTLDLLKFHPADELLPPRPAPVPDGLPRLLFPRH